jgi:hypothetical protein
MAQSLLNAAAKFPNDSPRISCSLPCCFDTAYLRLLLFVQQQILGDEANGREFYEPIATRLAQRYLGVPDMFMHFGVGELLVKRVLSRQPIAQIRPAAPVDAAVLSLFSNQDPSDAPWPPEEWQSRISVLLHSYIAGRY